MLAPERATIQTTIAAACATYEPYTALSQDQQTAIVRRIERSCFNYTIATCTGDGIDRLFTNDKFRARYSATCARVLLNLNSASSLGSTYLINAVINGTIDANDVGSMSSAELCPEANQAQRDMINARQNQRAIQKVSRKYECGKCHKKETTIEQYQARGSDESSNESIVCINCGHFWRL